MEFIRDVEALPEKRFPDILFERLSRRLGEEDRIRLVLDPNVPRAVKHDVGESSEPAAPTTDAFFAQRDEKSISAPEADTSLVSDERVDRHASTLNQLLHGIMKVLYDPKAKKWKRWPTTNQQKKEIEIAEFLNKVVAEASKFVDKQRGKADVEALEPSVFLADHKVKPVQAVDGESIAKRKPDIVLRAKGDTHSKTWETVRGIISVKSQAKYSVTSENHDLAQYVRLVFGNQKSRRFVLCATLFDTKLRLWKYDRSGPIASKEFDVHKYPEVFLRIIVGLAFSEDYFLGYDPSIIRRGDEEYIMLNGAEYRILDKLQLDSVIRGRGSAVLLVEDPVTKQKKIMKDQWVDVTRKTKEFEMLQVLAEKQVKNVATCENYQLVHFQIGQGVIEKDTTRSDRDSQYARLMVEELDLEIRDHYRLLISPFGHKLESFRSLRELVSAFRDYFKVIQDLYEEDVVHRDISPRNVILVEIEGELERRGYIIDFDYAILQSRSEIAQGERTGTLPFMAVEVMQNKGIQHRYYHDVESLFYVLVWTCLYQQGPNEQCRPDDELNAERNPLHMWCATGRVNEAKIRSIAYSKRGTLWDPEAFLIEVLGDLPPYFGYLRTLLRELRAVIFAKDPIIETKEGIEVKIQGDPKSMKKRDPKAVFTDIFAAIDTCLAELPEEKIESNAPQSGSAKARKVKYENPLSNFIDLRPLNVEPRRSLRIQNQQSVSLPSSLQSSGGKRSRDAVAPPSFSSSKRSKMSDD